MITSGYGCLKSNKGFLTILVLYILFGYQYFITVYYGILYESVQVPKKQAYLQIISTLIFSLFWTLMFISHIQATFTKPGSVPPKQQLNLQTVGGQFWKIVEIRELIYFEGVVRRKIRKGEIQNYTSFVGLNDSVRNIDPIEESNYFHSKVQEQLRADDSSNVSLKRNNQIDSLILKQCLICQSIQPPSVYHCSECNKCICFMDHHCPWINNCVGLYNQKPFLLFTFYAAITFGYGASVLTEIYTLEFYSDIPMTYIVQVFAISATSQWLGFLFVLVVSFDQVVVIQNRLSIIERIQIDLGRLKDGSVLKRGLSNWVQAFGEPPCWRWFVPSRMTRQWTVEEMYS